MTVVSILLLIISIEHVTALIANAIFANLGRALSGFSFGILVAIAALVLVPKKLDRSQSVLSLLF